MEPINLEDSDVFLFLDFIEQQMMVHPELIVEADIVQLERIAELVKDVKLED